jgi:pimeloyl-CoA synthetase
MSEKEKIQQERSDVEWVTSTEQGRRFLWKILSHCGIYRDIEGNSDEMLKQIGRRQAGLYLLGLITDESEDRFIEMMREAKNRAIEEKIKHDNANNSDTDSNGTSSELDSIIGDSSSASGSNPIF